MQKKQQSGNTIYKEDNISADLEIIKGLHREHEDGYTSSMKPSLEVLNGGLEEEEQRVSMKMIEMMQLEEKENTSKFIKCITGI
jgi:hypothetical protein